MRPIEIHPDICSAETLPSWCYRDQDFFALCRDHIIARRWQIVPVEAPAEPGAAPFPFLKGCLDEPLLLTTDALGKRHCVSNVCTHRGTVLTECKAEKLRCPYHGRRFGLDGSFRSMPGFEDALDFPRPEDDLKRLAMHDLGPFRLTSLDPSRPFEEIFSPLAGLFSADLKLDPSGSRAYHGQANWLLYLENFLEGFHIPFVHPALQSALGDAPYEIELYAAASAQVARDAAGGRGARARYCFAFPNLMFNFYPWGLSLNIAVPISVNETRVEFQKWVADPAALADELSGDLDLIQREDEQVVEGMQRGMQSRLYHRGRYAPRHELAVHHFHSLIAAAAASSS